MDAEMAAVSSASENKMDLHNHDDRDTVSGYVVDPSRSWRMTTLRTMVDNDGDDHYNQTDGTVHGRSKILTGCASVLNTNSSKLINESSENSRYRYLSVSARKNDSCQQKTHKKCHDTNDHNCDGETRN
jgi:hypothetical protein